MATSDTASGLLPASATTINPPQAYADNAAANASRTGSHQWSRRIGTHATVYNSRRCHRSRPCKYPPTRTPLRWLPHLYPQQPRTPGRNKSALDWRQDGHCRCCCYSNLARRMRRTTRCSLRKLRGQEFRKVVANSIISPNGVKAWGTCLRVRRHRLVITPRRVRVNAGIEIWDADSSCQLRGANPTAKHALRQTYHALLCVPILSGRAGARSATGGIGIRRQSRVMKSSAANVKEPGRIYRSAHGNSRRARAVGAAWATWIPFVRSIASCAA